MMPNNNFSVSLRLKAKYKGKDDYAESVKLTKGNEYDIFVLRNYEKDVFPCIDVMVLDHGRYGTISYSETKYAKEDWGKAVCEANDELVGLDAIIEGELNG